MESRSSSRRLGLEALEHRTLMAGNVLVSVDATGLLTMQGDSADNMVQIEQLVNDGPSGPWPGVRYAISAVDPNNMTTINGQTEVVVEGVKSVDIAMRDGADRVFAHAPHRPGRRAHLPGIVNIDMGSSAYTGSDSLTLRVENHKQININLGPGVDSLDMDGVVHQLNILGDPVYSAEDTHTPFNDDHMRFRSLKADGPVTIDTKYGDDEVSLLGTFTANSNSTWTIFTGSGNDRVSVLGTDWKSALRIDTGIGDDDVSVSGLQHATALTVNTGRGDDEVQIGSRGVDIVFDSFAVWLGAGDDYLNLLGVKSAKSNLNGADDTDTLQTHQEWPSDLGEATIAGFEIHWG